MRVLMTPEATPEEVAAVRENLKANTAVARVAYLDRAQSFEEMQRMFSREPDLLRHATEEGSPTFFRCTLTDSTIRLPRNASNVEWRAPRCLPRHD